MWLSDFEEDNIINGRRLSVDSSMMNGKMETSVTVGPGEGGKGGWDEDVLFPGLQRASNENIWHAHSFADRKAKRDNLAADNSMSMSMDKGDIIVVVVTKDRRRRHLKNLQKCKKWQKWRKTGDIQVLKVRQINDLIANGKHEYVVKGSNVKFANG